VRRLSRGTRKREENDARQGSSGALSFERQNSGALDHNGLAPEDDRFARARYGRETASGLASADPTFGR